MRSPMTSDARRPAVLALPALLSILLLSASTPSSAQTAPTDEAPSVLILNARLIDREGEEEDATAHLLVREGRLSLVTRDPIPASEADLALDAENGCRGRINSAPCATCWAICRALS